MNVFISWSGNNSKKLAEILRKWLPAVLQHVKPYFTPSDVEKGTRWNTDIGKELESSEVGILCLTRDSLHGDWLLFEAGALSKSLDKAHVCPILFGITNTDLAGPLKQFQTTEFEKNDIKKLVSVINTKLGDNKLDTEVLESVFEKWWPDLEAAVSEVLNEQEGGDPEPVRRDRELLEEVLELTRSMAQRVRMPVGASPIAIREIVEKYIELHDDQVVGTGGYQETLDRLESMKKAISYIAKRFLNPSDETDGLLLDRLKDLPFKHQKKIVQTQSDDDDLPF